MWEHLAVEVVHRPKGEARQDVPHVARIRPGGLTSWAPRRSRIVIRIERPRLTGFIGKRTALQLFRERDRNLFEMRGAFRHRTTVAARK
jgi:hypothetical protein